MIRTQIQLTETQAEQLRRLAARLDVSAAEVVRRLIDEAATHMASDEERRARALAVVGQFASGQSDVSDRHDSYLAEAFAE